MARPVLEIPWWRRWFGGHPQSTRAARSAWRRSLPVGYRIRRWVVGILAVALVGGGLTLIGRNPIGWIAARLNDVRGVQVPITTVTAVAVPVELPGFPAAGAIDGKIDTSWSTPWPLGQQPITGCALPSTAADPAAPGSVVVSLGATRRVTSLQIVAGLGTPDRVNQPLPKTLQIGYQGGCTDVALTESAELQTRDLDITTDAVWLTVTDVWPSKAVTPVQQVSISEFTFLARPL